MHSKYTACRVPLLRHCRWPWSAHRQLEADNHSAPLSWTQLAAQHHPYSLPAGSEQSTSLGSFDGTVIHVFWALTAT